MNFDKLRHILNHVTIPTSLLGLLLHVKWDTMPVNIMTQVSQKQTTSLVATCHRCSYNMSVRKTYKSWFKCESMNKNILTHEQHFVMQTFITADLLKIYGIYWATRNSCEINGYQCVKLLQRWHFHKNTSLIKTKCFSTVLVWHKRLKNSREYQL